MAKTNRLTRTPEQRFMEKVLVQPNGCWVWQGAKTFDGYGHFKLNPNKKIRAHHFFLPRALGWREQANHRCNNPSCVRFDPQHVYIGTAVDNYKDRRLVNHVPYELRTH